MYILWSAAQTAFMSFLPKVWVGWLPQEYAHASLDSRPLSIEKDGTLSAHASIALRFLGIGDILEKLINYCIFYNDVIAQITAVLIK